MEVFGEMIEINLEYTQWFIFNYLIMPAFSAADKLCISLVDRYDRGDLLCKLCIIDDLIKAESQIFTLSIKTKNLI
jgi:hypothetical protein